jgi:hypothetical protein
MKLQISTAVKIALIEAWRFLAPIEQRVGLVWGKRGNFGVVLEGKVVPADGNDLDMSGILMLHLSTF